MLEFADPRLLVDALRLDLLQSMSKHVRKFFKDPRLLELVEFPVLFLGATPENTPALYSLMNYADLALGTWYPMGGMHKIVAGMVSLAEELGVNIEYGQPVEEILVEDGRAVGVRTAAGPRRADVVVAGADYHHAEQHLLAPAHRRYRRKILGHRARWRPPRCCFTVGVNKRLDLLRHHNLFFDQDFGRHAREIYEQPQWPTAPLFYVSAPSQTDPSVAPAGSENLFLLVPVAPDLPDPDDTREHYYDLIMDRLERHCGQSLSATPWCSSVATPTANSYGTTTATRATPTAWPTRCARPPSSSPPSRASKVANLYFTGQLTVPGPGVPPSLISGQVVAGEIINAIMNYAIMQLVNYEL